MDYRNMGDTLYIRMDKGDEIIACILEVCQKEAIKSATYNGIGGCSEAKIQTFIPEKKEFETQTLEGMLELVSLTGSVILDEPNGLYHHTHAMFAYKDGDKHCVAGGHVKSITVLYTAEIVLKPIIGGLIKRKYNPETGTGFWDFQ